MYYIYTTSNGQIKWQYEGPNAALQPGIGEAFIYSEDIQDGLPETHYINGNSVALRPANLSSANKTTIDADGVDQLIISNIPSPSRLDLIGPLGDTQAVNIFDVTTGSFTLTTDVIGTYRVKIFSFPQLDTVIEIGAI